MRASTIASRRRRDRPRDVVPVGSRSVLPPLVARRLDVGPVAGVRGRASVTVLVALVLGTLGLGGLASGVGHLLWGIRELGRSVFDGGDA